MKNRNVLRKIALAVVIVMLLGSFTGCKSTSGNGVSGVLDTNGVAGDEIQIEIPEGGGSNNENEGTNNEGTNNEGANNEGTNNEGTDNEGANNEGTNNEGTDNEGTNNEGTNNEGTNSEGTNNEGNNYEDLFKEDEVVKPAYDESKELVIVSYNIKCAWYSKTIDQVVEQIKAADADIVGFQEVDYFTSRSKNINQIETIASKAGFPYFYFEPVIEYGKNTEKVGDDVTTNMYGHAVMSKYPIKKSEIIWPTAQSDGGEPRNFGRHEIDVDGTTIAFYNTHLDFSKGREQYMEVEQKYMVNDEYAICVGDFNETYSEFGSYMDQEIFFNFTFGDNGDNVIYRTNADTGEKSQMIDHIIVTKDKFVWQDGGVGNGLHVTEHDGASDHNMIYCHLNIIK